MDISSTNATPVSTVVQNAPQDTRQQVAQQPQQAVDSPEKTQQSSPSADGRVGSSIDVFV